MADWQKIVVKVGTSTIVDLDGQIKYPVVNRLAQTLSTLQKEGHQVLLVTSGAMGVALNQMNLHQRPKEIPKQQALAAIEPLFDQGAIPIINENDVIAVDELDHQHSFGDNDRLAALVAKQIQADGLIILSDVDALYTANPNIDQNAKPIHRVEEITETIWLSATGSTSGLGTGGMSTKLAAADLTMKYGQKMALVNRNNPANILAVIAGEEIGTLFEE
ncbi:gamma-glutamyl kinase [Fructobacillus cardui]|uniref:amino acid kinase family protein n=1 Tax=Fructobacillus cardui TaxID=2893170 RepID=UPI00200A1762|nr:gamma-glutamyl kinase [Fructobacillus cardui]MCK8627063.1 gamma-glutamyl kinase [Fructobacillus cardui]